MYCTKCGKELLDEAVICPECGCPTSNYNNATNSDYNSENHMPDAPLTDVEEAKGIVSTVKEKLKKYRIIVLLEGFFAMASPIIARRIVDDFYPLLLIIPIFGLIFIWFKYLPEARALSGIRTDDALMNKEILKLKETCFVTPICCVFLLIITAMSLYALSR